MEVEIENLRLRLNALQKSRDDVATRSNVGRRDVSAQIQGCLQFMGNPTSRISDLYLQSSIALLTVRSMLANSVDIPEEWPAVDELSTDLKEQTHALIDQLKNMTDTAITQDISDKRDVFSTELSRVTNNVAEIEGIYSEFAGIRDMLETAFVDESNVQYRLVNEFPALRESVKKICNELEFIREEKQKLRIKLRKEYPSVPLEELTEVSETPNAAWSDLVGNIRLAQISI